jgi:23S rRNA pseudouridine2605 synthase
LIIRINKFLSEAGLVSRREADRLIAEGRVRVNGRVVDELGSKVDDERDLVQVDGRRVRNAPAPVYVLLNKPKGYLVTLKDPFGRPTVRSLLPAAIGRIFPVGRLDLDSEGLLFLTNDGDLAYRLMHPKFGVNKVYIAKVEGRPDKDALQKLARGVAVGGKRTAPARVALLSHSPKSSWLRLELYEGRKREVREMCRAVGHEVLELKRVEFAGLVLGKLKPGEWRELLPGELRRLQSLGRPPASRRPGQPPVS